MAALSLAQMRDQIRRYIRVTPPIDPPVSSAVAGQQPTDTPDPNNNTINQAINDGVYFINRIVRVGLIQDVNIAVTSAPPTKRGAFWVDMSSKMIPLLSVAEIENVWWIDATNPAAPVAQHLAPLNYYQYTTVNRDFQQLAPSVNVSQFIVSGVQVGLIPAPVNPGTLSCTVVNGIAPLLTDTDTILYLPVDLQQAVLYWAVVILAMRRANDVEGASLMQTYTALAQDATEKIWMWKNGYDAAGITAIRAQMNMTSLLTLQAQQSPPVKAGS